MVRGSPADCGRKPMRHEFSNYSRGQSSEITPTNTRPFFARKKFQLDHRIGSEPLPMMSFEANRRGAFLGAVFSKIFHPRYRVSPRPRAEVFASLEPSPPDSFPTYLGGRGSSRIVFLSIDSAGALSPRARRTGTERQGGFRLPHENHPQNWQFGSAQVRELRTSARRTTRSRPRRPHHAFALSGSTILSAVS
jgi:hypothetical protein